MPAVPAASGARAIRSAPVPPLAGLLAGLRLALGTGAASRNRALLSRVTDWRTVARLAAHHRVSTLLLQGIHAGGIAIPDAAAERDVARRRQRDVLRGMRQIDAMRRVTAGLDGGGIPSLILKGLPLGQRLYGQPFAKSSIDIDLLVPPPAFTAAARALRGLGWRRTMPDFRETPARMRWYDTLQKEHVFIDRGGNTLELHRRLFANPFLFDPSFARLAASGATVEVAGRPLRTLGDADQLVYLACHGALHYWQRLKWLCDAAMLLGVGEVFTQAVARARPWRLEHLLYSTLLLCREALHVETPRVAAALPAGNQRLRFVAGLSQRAWSPPGRLEHVAREAAMGVGRVFIGSGMRYRLHESLGFLIQPHDFARVDLPDRLFWCYAILRPVLWLSRALRRAQSGRSQ